MEAAVAARLCAVHRPPPWIDVTIALRFMVEDGRIILHKVRLLFLFLLFRPFSLGVIWDR